MKKLSVTIITLNEEENIKRCISSVKDIADEIILVDSNSTDSTTKIARELGAKIFKRKFDNYANQKNFAMSKANFDWIYSIDADEENTLELNNEILNALQKTEYRGYLIPRRNILLGKEIKHTRWSPDKHVWLWNKKYGEWKGVLHEEVVVNGEVGELKNAKIHYQYPTVKSFMNMINSYTDREAGRLNNSGVKFSFVKMNLRATLSFFRRFNYKKGFLDGWRGYVLSCLMSIYHLVTWVKLWELQKTGK